MRAVKIALGIALLSFAAAAAAAGPLAGTASVVAGAVSAVAANGQTRLLVKGDPVYSGDHVITGQAAYVRLAFLDGGAMVLRPKTEFAIEGYAFKPAETEAAAKPVPTKPTLSAIAAGSLPALQLGNQGGGGNKALFRLLRGGFRAVSGLIGKLNREEYAVRTPVATIGIRGTVYFSVYCDEVCAADPLVQSSLPPGESALGGMVSGVEQGAIAITSTTGNEAVVESSKFLLTTAAGVNVPLLGLPGFLLGEHWLAAAQQAAVGTPSAAAVAEGAGFSAVPVGGGIAAIAAFAAALVLNVDSNSGVNNSTSTSTSTTSPR